MRKKMIIMSRKLYGDAILVLIWSQFLPIAHKGKTPSLREWGLDNQLIKTSVEDYLKNIIKITRMKNVDCRLTSEVSPYHMKITGNYVFICFNIPNKMTGLLVKDNKAAKEFLEFFESIYEKSESLLPVLENFKV